MLTEIYRKPQATHDGPLSASTEVDLYEQSIVRRYKLLSDAGFDTRRRVESNSAHSRSKLETTRHLYEELDGKRFSNWKKFLPTVTSTSSYNFDEVPEEALEAIIEAKELHCFSHIEIWTPEGNSFLGLVARRLNVAKDKLDKFIAQLDPMAVGVITVEGKVHYFPIVRWGESLLPYKKVQSQVRRTHSTAWILFGVLPALLVMFGLAAYYNGIVHYGYSSMAIGTLMAIIVIMVSTFITIAILDISTDW